MRFSNLSEKKMHAPAQPFGSFFPLRARNRLPVIIVCIILSIFLLNSGQIGRIAYRSGITPGHFPRKIWQSWKVDPLNFEERDLNLARTWVGKNPSYRYEVLTDTNDMQYVESHYGPEGFNRPDIVYIYRHLTAKIIKADLLRYLIMYAEGGVWADIDVEALRPLDYFIPERYNEQQIDMIVGVEIDEPYFTNHTILGQKSQSFCQWTFICKPKLPVMLKLINNIIVWLDGVAREQNKPIADIELDFDQVISGTGPSAFTNVILAEMSRREGHEIRWNSFTNLRESKSVGGILVLTVEALAAGQGHSDSGNHDGKMALVKHHYHASGWPSSHHRFSHPLFGEVEACNWNVECVRKWDEEVAEFNALPEDEQQKRIALKEAENAENE